LTFAHFSLCSDADQKKGYNNLPILDGLDFDAIVLDEMHSLLRIFDKLQHLLQKEELKENDDLLAKYVSAVQKILKDESFQYYVGEHNAISWSTLDASDRLKILEEIDFTDIIPARARAPRVTSLWHGFADLYKLYSADEPQPDLYKQKLGEWMELFTSGPCPGTDPVRARRPAGLRSNTPEFENWLASTAPLYPHAHATPYIHQLTHFLYHIRKESLKPWSCCSLEKKNHMHTVDFFRSTMRGGCSQSAMKQILTRELILTCWEIKVPPPPQPQPPAPDSMDTE
jgi:hypothetical protein